MKIGIYSPYLDTLTGGELYILTAAACLSKNNDVEIFWDDKDILKKASLKFSLALDNITVRPNIFNTRVTLAKRLLKTKKYDAILYLSDGSIPLVASKKLYIHFQFPVEWVKLSIGTRLKMGRVDKCICNSHYTKRYIDAKFHVKSFVLYPPANLCENEREEKENLILTVGRFSLMEDGTDFKKIGIMGKAFKEFQKKRLKDWKMVIATSVRDEQEKEFEEFRESLKSVHIEIHKNPSYRQLRNLYAKSKIYWHGAGFGDDLLKHPERAEHFGITTIEAMSFGCIPIVINAGGQKEIIDNRVNGFLWNTIPELVDITHKVARSKELFEDISKESIASSKQFSKERFCQELGQLIR